MCSKCGIVQRKIWVFGCGSFIFFLALIIGLLWPNLSLQILTSQLVLKEGSMNYKNWIETPIPIYMEIYMFDWKNPEQLNDHNLKPIFEEKGPYVFTEKHKRVDVEWHKNGSVSFYQVRTWHFSPERSNGTLDDKITCANVISATVAAFVRNKSKAVKFLANFMLLENGGSLAVTKTVRELLFDGYDDKLLDFIKKVNTTNINIPFKKFGWFVERNESKTYDGYFTMNDGQTNINTLGKLTEWNYVKITNFYQNNCSIVKGTTGELWPPNMNPYTSKTVFATDFCRYITLNYDKKITKYGITGSKWIGDDSVFDDGNKYPNMKCFCPKDDICPKYGVLDVSKCKFDAPVTVSYPHFYLAHASYIDSIIGMKPNKEKHEFSLALEPSTGIPLEVRAKLQINLHLRQISEFKFYKNIKDVMMPMIWFTQKIDLDEDLAEQAKLAINLSNIGIYTSYGIGALAIIIIIVGIILTITKRWKRTVSDDEEILSD